MSHSLDISIIVTARNYGRYLRDCLESCLWQDMPAREVIYCDDGSDDDSVEIASSLDRVTLRLLPSRCGVCEARNQAAAKASGSALLFVDGDNILPVNFLSRCADALSPLNSFAYTDFSFFGTTAEYRRKPEWEQFDLWDTTENYCDTCSLIWADVFHNAGGWCETPHGHVLEDYLLFMRASCFGSAKRADVAIGYRLHPCSHTSELLAAVDMGECQRDAQAAARTWATARFGRIPSRDERDSGRLEWDEEDYLTRNPDVRRDVDAGIWQNGRQHYHLHGYREGRARAVRLMRSGEAKA